MSLPELRRMRLLLAVGILFTGGAGGLSGCVYDDSCYDERVCLSLPKSPCEGDPATAPALDECGVFVSEQGDDESPGTRSAPVRTMQHAIGLAASGRGDAEAPTWRVYACGGAFAEEITLPAGVDLWGSRRCDGGDDWSYGGSFAGPNASTIIGPPDGIPVRVLGGGEAVVAGNDATSVIFGVRAVAADASARDGKSSIAMILSRGARAIVRDSVIVAGGGSEGEPGEDAPSEPATDGEQGSDGAHACTADVVTGARPVVTRCDDGTESVGGYGGDGGLDVGGDGASGQPASEENQEATGRGGSGADTMRCTKGSKGAAGADAGRAAGASGPGFLDIDGWVGVRGEDGKNGGVGHGGGGGGGSKGRGELDSCRDRPPGGAAGGSGGSGGCGGLGGKGGGYGGASIGIIALEGAELTVEASDVFTGDGGRGGVGGTGQWGGRGAGGGRGGSHPFTELWPACPGGRGGNGGRGGDAGGGSGGHSLGVASVGATVTLAQDASVHHGDGGSGGPAGNAAPDEDEGKGDPGLAYFWYRFDAPAPAPPR
ncbi:MULTISPECIES: hypothetical protein [Sorangium]|uniref:PE-PGRS family protein n=1 Tax=Sorangium cellulosum TaxID=56 RepID=A0A4P2QUW9_SORCE|nr:MULTISPECIES: hypothetical protein [Sorangium]AUX34204.1 hypothetical protein SOCE836_063730 [Sorangium cellulosum]WCQ93519.1 hypothetical protein NQZ70_06268 [Sorangium sp. Soce836]